MRSKTSTILLAASVAIAAGLNLSCSSDDGPRPGTPAFYWTSAKDSFSAGDYNKTAQHLDKILASDNEFTGRALAWQLVLTSGTIRGYMDVADNLELAVRMNKADPGQFRKYVLPVGRDVRNRAHLAAISEGVRHLSLRGRSLVCTGVLARFQVKHKRKRAFA